LPTGLAPAVFWALGFRALESVAGGRLAAVGAVFAETFFELGDAGFKSGDFSQVAGLLLLEQIDHQTANRIQSALIEGDLDCRSECLLSVMHWGVYVSEVVNFS